MRLLVVEDDPELGRRLTERLRSADFAVELAASRSEAEDWPDVDRMSAVILDAWPGVLVGLVMACLLAIAVSIRFAYQTRTQRFAIFVACEVAFMLGCLLGLWLIWESVPG